MKLDGLPREKVLATIVSLLRKTLVRVGNAEYAEKNKSYGLTTMRRKHVAIGRGVLRFEFTGKSGKLWKLRVEDKRIAAIVKRCAELSGQELFKYLDDDGEPRTVDSGDVNAYIKEITGEDFSAKDFRTWAGTVLAALALVEFKKYDRQTEAKRNVVAAIESVSKQLGNTPAICRKCYVHPEVLNAYMSGDLVKMIEAKIAQKFKRQYAKLTSDDHGARISSQAAQHPCGPQPSAEYGETAAIPPPSILGRTQIVRHLRTTEETTRARPCISRRPDCTPNRTARILLQRRRRPTSTGHVHEASTRCRSPRSHPRLFGSSCRQPSG